MALGFFVRPIIVTIPDAQEQGFELPVPADGRLFSLMVAQVSGPATDLNFSLYNRKEAVPALRGSYSWDPTVDGDEDNYLVIAPQTVAAGSKLQLFGLNQSYANADTGRDRHNSKLYMRAQTPNTVAPTQFAISMQVELYSA